MIFLHQSGGVYLSRQVYTSAGFIDEAYEAQTAVTLLGSTEDVCFITAGSFFPYGSGLDHVSVEGEAIISSLI